MNMMFAPECVFRTPSQLMDYLRHNIESNPDPLAGLEEEIIVLGQKGRPIGHGAFQALLIDLMKTLPQGVVHQGRSVHGNVIEALYGSFAHGWVQPETNTTLIEFAHAPTTSALQSQYQSENFTQSLCAIAPKHNVVVIGAGIVPTASWVDFHCGDDPTVIPNADYIYSWGHMKHGTRPEYCRTVFGTGSVHHNMGFKDPDALAAYAATTLRLQPMMIGLMGNAPLWNLQRASNENSQLVLSQRSQVQINYGKLFGMDGVAYLYPDFMLDRHFSFTKLVQGYIDLPLDRTIVDGQKISVCRLTMRDYMRDGIVQKGQTYYPGLDAITMMFREPICDVRLSMVGSAPRVETRAHDCVSQSTSVALDAFYQGVLRNLEEVRSFVNGMDGADIRRQRREACVQGMKTPVHHIRQDITTMQHLALHVLALAARGLCARGLGEERLLSPLVQLAESGRNPAEHLLEVWRPDDNASVLLQALRYNR